MWREVQQQSVGNRLRSSLRSAREISNWEDECRLYVYQMRLFWNIRELRTNCERHYTDIQRSSPWWNLLVHSDDISLDITSLARRPMTWQSITSHDIRQNNWAQLTVNFSSRLKYRRNVYGQSLNANLDWHLRTAVRFCLCSLCLYFEQLSTAFSHHTSWLLAYCHRGNSHNIWWK